MRYDLASAAVAHLDFVSTEGADAQYFCTLAPHLLLEIICSILMGLPAGMLLYYSAATDAAVLHELKELLRRFLPPGRPAVPTAEKI